MLRQRRFFQVACVLGALGVVVGAFGAHGLKGHLEATHPADRAAQLLAIFDTGVKYHLVHAVALLALTLAPERLNLWPEPAAGGGRLTVFAALCFVAGMALFSGSLYLLAATDMRWLGMITPFGGVALILGWLTLPFAAKTKSG